MVKTILIIGGESVLIVLFLMCLVVDYSEKLVKSDYFGVIVYKWWRKVQKIGIFAIQNAYFAESSYEHPNIGIFDLKHRVERSCRQNTPKTWDIR